MDTNNAYPPRHRIAGHIYDQAKELGIEWRFPCNPCLDDLCERGELAGVVPIIVFLPANQAESVLDGRAALRYTER